MRVVARGDALLAPNVTRRLLDRVAPTLTRSQAPVADALAALTDRERRCSDWSLGADERGDRGAAGRDRGRPSRRTWATCWQSSACETGSRRWCWPTSSGWSGRLLRDAPPARGLLGALIGPGDRGTAGPGRRGQHDGRCSSPVPSPTGRARSATLPDHDPASTGDPGSGLEHHENRCREGRQPALRCAHSGQPRPRATGMAQAPAEIGGGIPRRKDHRRSENRD